MKFWTDELTLCTSAVSETAGSVTLTFILAMLLHPEVQKKAQQEVDSVVGCDRLPDFLDIPHLRYLSAVVKEVLRQVAETFSSCKVPR
jgi:cytochrome P450